MATKLQKMSQERFLALGRVASSMQNLLNLCKDLDCPTWVGRDIKHSCEEIIEYINTKYFSAKKKKIERK